MIDYLQRTALTDQKIKSSTTLVWIHDNSVVLGFVTITMYSINKKDLISQDNTWKQFPHRTIPAILIGQLATHKKYECIGVGKMMLDSVIETVDFLSKKIGCRVVALHPQEDVISWYRKQKFNMLEMRDGQKVMYVDILKWVDT